MPVSSSEECLSSAVLKNTGEDIESFFLCRSLELSGLTSLELDLVSRDLAFLD
jgi:hypothetical protein